MCLPACVGAGITEFGNWLPPPTTLRLCDHFVIFLSFCEQDNWRMRKQRSTKLGRHFWWWSGSACGFRITF